MTKINFITNSGHNAHQSGLLPLGYLQLVSTLKFPSYVKDSHYYVKPRDR